MTQKGARFGCELIHQDRNAGFVAPKCVLEVLLEWLSVGRKFPNLIRGLRFQRRRNEADLRQVILVVAVLLVRVADRDILNAGPCEGAGQPPVRMSEEPGFDVAPLDDFGQV